KASMVIERGEKVAFVGKNGEGKSTMIKAIMGEIDYEGSLKVGHNAQIGYFAQNQASLLDEELTVFETIDQIAVGEVRVKIKDRSEERRVGKECRSGRLRWGVIREELADSPSTAY